MLAKLAREFPAGGDWVFEPKWDGFRCLAFRDGPAVALFSRNQRPLARYFPEIVEAFRLLSTDRFVVDGELMVTAGETADFGALLARLHPAPSRVALLRRETPACFVAFDLLARGDDDLRELPFARRRDLLAGMLAGAPENLRLTPATSDSLVAADWLDATGAGIDGVVAKRPDQRYEPGRRAMLKIKRERTADCVVAGFRLVPGERAVGSLLLGLDDAHGQLHHVGVIAAFTKVRRAALVDELLPYLTGLTGHPWEHGFLMAGGRLGHLPGAAGRWTPADARDWVPVRPELVCEVAYDSWEGDRFRHAARFRRWRPDRDAGTCTLAQMENGR
jgi:ATP-dependent DNA ligase